MNRSSNSKLVLFIFAIVDIAIVIGLVFFANYKNTVKAVATINLMPTSAVIKIDGHEYTSGVHEFDPQKITATISAEEFQDKTIELDLKSDTITEIAYMLEPEDPNYWAKHPGEANLLNDLNSEEAKKIAKIVSIKDQLPISYYKYGGSLDSKSQEIAISEKTTSCVWTFCLIITSNMPNGLEKAKQMIKEKGFDPDDYKIEYKAR